MAVCWNEKYRPVQLEPNLNPLQAMTGLYKEIDLKQGTPEWRKWRNGGFGSSDIPALMGENPWRSVRALIEGKKGLKKEFQNAAMRRGHMLESEARQKYIEEVGREYYPICIQHTKYFWARASLDGISADRNYVVEIKCGKSAYEKAVNFEVPQYYYGQLQHILFVTGLDLIDYWCYLPGREGILIEVERDHGYISDLVEKCEMYKDQLIENE